MSDSAVGRRGHVVSGTGEITKPNPGGQFESFTDYQKAEDVRATPDERGRIYTYAA